jgi:hypothetical protein
MVFIAQNHLHLVYILNIASISALLRAPFVVIEAAAKLAYGFE